MVDMAKKGINPDVDLPIPKSGRNGKKGRMTAQSSNGNPAIDETLGGHESQIAWVLEILGWLNPVSKGFTATEEQLQRLPHPDFAAFLLEKVIGPNGKAFGFVPPPQVSLTPSDEPETLGPEWEDAIGEKWKQEEKRHGRASDPLLQALRLRWDGAGSVLDWLGEEKLGDQLSCPWPLLPLAFDTGREIINAYLRKDVPFFDDLARVVRVASGSGRANDESLRIVVIETAESLAELLKRNPSGEELKAEYAKRGHPPVSDWTKMLKNSRLASFVKCQRGGVRSKRKSDKRRSVL